MKLIVFLVTVFVGPVAFIAITARGWQVERSGPLGDTLRERIVLGALLVASLLFTMGMGYLWLYLFSE